MNPASIATEMPYRHAALAAVLALAITGAALGLAVASTDPSTAPPTPEAEPRLAASGALDAQGALYHAYLHQPTGTRSAHRVIVLAVDSQGTRHPFDQSMEFHLGGSGNWRMEDIEFKNQSLFVTFGGHWRKCTHRCTSQFRLRKGRLKRVGVEPSEENTKRNLAVESSTNFLTGIGFSKRGKLGAMYSVQRDKWRIAVRRHKASRELLPFSAFDGEPFRPLDHNTRPIC